MSVAHYFVSSGLVRPAELDRFSAAETEARRLRDSRAMEGLLFGLAVASATIVVFGELHGAGRRGAWSGPPERTPSRWPA